MIALLPLSHFIFAIASLAWKRGKRGILLFSLLLDTVIIATIFVHLSNGEPISIVLGGWRRGMGIELAADQTSLAFSLLILLLSAAVLAYLWNDRMRSYFYMLLHLMLGATFALILARDLFNIYVVMELLTLTSVLLIAYERRPHQIWASLKYLLFASLGMSLYLLGVALTYYHTGTLNLVLLAERIPREDVPNWVILAASLLVVGVAVKAGIFIFSLWLPAAHSVALPAVSALLSGVVIKKGVVDIIRLAPIFPISFPLLILAAISAFLGVLYTLSTTNLRRMLAFSTLSQIGYLILGIGIGTEIALSGSLGYAVAHGLFKGLLFLAAGVAIKATGQEEIAGLIALRHRIPVAARASLLLGTLGIVSMPPLAGFYGKSLLSAGTASPVIQMLLVLISIGTMVAFARLIPLFWLGRGPSMERSKIVSFFILGLPIIFFLPLARLFIPLEQWRVSLYPLLFLESLIVIAAGIFLYRILYRRPFRLPQRIFRLEEAILIILTGFFLVFFLTMPFR